MTGWNNPTDKGARRPMRDDQHRFLALLGHLPARLTAEQAAWVINRQAHDIPILVSTRLLKLLGNPPPNGIKFFGTCDVLELSRDRNWLARVSNAIYQHWHQQNARRKERVVVVSSQTGSAETVPAVSAAA